MIDFIIMWSKRFTLIKKKKTFEYFDVAVTFCLNWMSARNMLFVVPFLHCRCFYD